MADFAAETRTHDGHGRGGDYLASAGSVAGEILQGVLIGADDEREGVLGYKITESVIRVGQPVFVMGNAQRAGETACVGRGGGRSSSAARRRRS